VSTALSALPPNLVDWIRSGNAVRTDAAAEFAGRCGAAVERRNAGAAFCGRAAGWGTDHKGVGRCKGHPLEADGLAPWVGVVAAEQWQAITGHNLPGPGGHLQATHGATTTLRSIEDLFADMMEATDAAVFRAVPTDDPVRLLDVVVRTNVVALYRVQGFIKKMREAQAAAGVGGRLEDTAGAESLAAKISSTIARLMESKAKYVEIEQRGESLDSLASLLMQLSDADFARVSQDPSLLSQYQPGGFNPGAPAGDGIPLPFAGK
jgi:hypothetical protein